MKKWIRAGFRSVLEIATSAKKLVKGMYHPKNQRMVVIRFSIFDDLFIYIYIQPRSVFQYTQEAATTEEAPWILLQDGFATCLKINRSAGKIQKECRSKLRLRCTIIDPQHKEYTHTHISIAICLHTFSRLVPSLPVHTQPVKKHCLLNAKVCQPCAAGATGLLGQHPTLRCWQMPAT